MNINLFERKYTEPELKKMMRNGSVRLMDVLMSQDLTLEFIYDEFLDDSLTNKTSEEEEISYFEIVKYQKYNLKEIIEYCKKREN